MPPFMSNKSYKPILLRADAVWTAGHAAPQKGWAVLAAGGRIAAVGPQINAGDAEVIELPGTTLLPGLMDLHSHLLLYPYNRTNWDDQVLKESESFRTARAVGHARHILMAALLTFRHLATESTR